MRTSSCGIFLFYLLGLAAYADELQVCEGSDRKSCDPMYSLLQEDGGSSGLEMLQRKGSLTPKRNCPTPELSDYQRKSKGCANEDPEKCINGNMAFSTLIDAWEQCQVERECGAVMQDTDGNFYLRRKSDPEGKLAVQHDVRLYPHNCEKITEKDLPEAVPTGNTDKTASKLKSAPEYTSNAQDVMVNRMEAHKAKQEKEKKKAKPAKKHATYEDEFETYMQTLESKRSKQAVEQQSFKELTPAEDAEPSLEDEFAQYAEQKHQEYEAWLKDQEAGVQAKIEHLNKKADHRVQGEIRERKKAQQKFRVQHQLREKAETTAARKARKLAKAKELLKAADRRTHRLQEKMKKENTLSEKLHKTKDKAESKAAEDDEELDEKLDAVHKEQVKRSKSRAANLKKADMLSFLQSELR